MVADWNPQSQSAIGDTRPMPFDMGEMSLNRQAPLPVWRQIPRRARVGAGQPLSDPHLMEDST